VELVPSSDGRAIELTIRDTGAGIPPSELPLLFERFHRVQGARSRTYEGTGIGLALVQELAKLLAVKSRCKANQNAEAPFTVRIPFGSAHLAS
jgi:signal transduction histidine kinase